ncbi:hypothetical protein [Ralstonia sp. SET104]|uniref:hypothetical protein n=1 Tax=Ralstonia sp. SET104 TaxID=2448774 RepID=UPI000F56684B|nr:hypothetical protein [Ralstonia sp. SET104]GCB06080.1 hypothetical protein PSUB009319_37110 [Ralstonia sp. SET104]
MTAAKHRIYLTGALALRMPRCFRADALRWELAYTNIHPPEYRRGFLDGIGAFVSMVLEGCQINPETWDVLTVLTAVERAGERQ